MQTKSQVDMAEVVKRVDDGILSAFRELRLGLGSYCHEPTLEDWIELFCDWTRHTLSKAHGLRGEEELEEACGFKAR